MPISPPGGSSVDPLEVVKAKAEYGGALRELSDLRAALQKRGGSEARLQLLVGAAEDRVAKAAAHLAALRTGR